MQERQITTINGASSSWQVAHRGTEADVGVLQQVFAEQSYSMSRFERWPGLAAFASSQALGGPPLVVDCGANIGASSMYFSILYPHARVVAVEPERENFELLLENVAPFPRVRAVRKAIASVPGKLALRDPGTGAWGYRTDGGAHAGPVLEEVDATTVAEILAQEPASVPFVLKVDIEGAEGELFANDTDALSRFPVVIVELHDWMLPAQRTSRSFLQWHLTQQRDFVYHGENVFSISSALVSTDGTSSGERTAGDERDERARGAADAQCAV